MDSQSMMDEELFEEKQRKQCFSAVQSRKIWSPIVSSGCRLCPSMDIVVVTTPPSLFLHRTVSWQKLVSLSSTDLDNEQATHVAWSPDGRAMAIALSDNSIVLHHIEGMSATAANSIGSDGANSNGRIHTIDNVDSVVALTWAHVGRAHAKWLLSRDEFEVEESWRYRSHYLDRSSVFLPPTSYQMDEESNEGESDFKSTLPSSRTPLSLLCVATAASGIHLYLHGRYHIATLPLDDAAGSNIVCSSDLSRLIVLSANSSTLNFYSLPTLKQHRYHLQIASALYCSITSHLNAIRLHSRETLASWKSSLKPLDLKLDGLTRLLKSYGVNDDVRTVLFRYIMVGHTSVSSDSSNAMDQFFTGVQMNDQLIQRLERSLHGAVANVESLARKGLLAPARALMYDAGEMRGQCSTFCSVRTMDRFYQSCEILLVTAEQMVTQLVEARFRLRDLVSWLRSIGSQVKAKGTAANSAHRENARKRRVPQAVVQRMASYLEPLSYASNASPTSVTECLLNVPLSDFFADDPTFVALPGRPSSPRGPSLETPSSPQKLPTLSYAVSRVSDYCNTVFEQPRAICSKSVFQTELILDSLRQAGAVGIHTRIGLDQLGGGESSSTGFFEPQVWGTINDGDVMFSCSRQWAIMAKTSSLGSGEDEFVQLFAIPMGRNSTREEDVISKDEIPFYLTSRVILPVNCKVKEIAFYGDDGKSSLSSGADSGTGEEGRQAMGLLLDHGDDGVSADSKGSLVAVSEELWLFSYDELIYQPILVKPGDVIALAEYVQEECTARVEPISDGDNSDEGFSQDESVVYAKTRQLRVHPLEESKSQHSGDQRLMLSGSRGIGGVFTTSGGYTSLDLFDLEEDEEEDSDEEEDAEE